MVLAIAYVIAAVVLAPSIFVAAGWIDHHTHAQAPHRAAYSLVAALLWPLLVAGLAEFGVTLAARHLVSRTGTVRTPAPDLDTVDTAQLRRLAVPGVGIGTPVA